MKKYKEMIDAIRNVQQENSYRTGSPRFLTAKDTESAESVECSRKILTNLLCYISLRSSASSAVYPQKELYQRG